MTDLNKLRHQAYDGIQEYDNDLPRWWVWLFWITIIYGTVYAVWFHAPSTPTPRESLETSLAELKSLQRASAPAGEIDEAGLLKLVTEQSIIAQGAQVYAGKCAACHGPDGQGLVGPNLTDAFWIHGGSVVDIRNVILNGVVEKGMLAWRGILSDQEVNAAVAFIWSIRGTAPANPKAPEGQPVS